MYKTKGLMLSEVIKKLQEAMDAVGDKPVYIDVNPGINEVKDRLDNVYKCTDVLYDQHNVKLYNY